MKRHFQFLSIALSLVAILSITSCSTDEGINSDDLSISERALGTLSAFSGGLIGLTPENVLISFHASNPAAQTAVAIQGLAIGENILAIELQPRTSTLYGVSSSNLLYRIDTRTGVATVISTRPFDPAMEGTMTGFDYNTLDGTLRLVTDADQNLRISPLTGDVVGVDVALSPDSLSISGIAFSTGTTKIRSAMYDIDVLTSSLFRQKYDSGLLTYVGRLGVDVLSEVGFDISTSGQGFAVFEGVGRPGGPTSNITDLSVPGYRLWQVNLSNGNVTALADISPMIGLAAY